MAPGTEGYDREGLQLSMRAGVGQSGGGGGTSGGGGGHHSSSQENGKNLHSK